MIEERDETYFYWILVGSGYRLEKGFLMNEDHTLITTYECNVCGALTTTPSLHEKWHKEGPSHEDRSEPLSLSDLAARGRNSSSTDPSWRTDYREGLS